jgi:hypothetical protein
MCKLLIINYLDFLEARFSIVSAFSQMEMNDILEKMRNKLIVNLLRIFLNAAFHNLTAIFDNVSIGFSPKYSNLSPQNGFSRHNRKVV